MSLDTISTAPSHPPALMDEPEGAYLDALYSLPKRQQLAELRRAYTLWLALEWATVPPPQIVKLASDLEGYLRDGLSGGGAELTSITGGRST